MTGKKQFPLIHHRIEKNHIILQGMGECLTGLVIARNELGRSERRKRVDKSVKEQERVTRGLVVIERFWLGGVCSR